MLHAKGFSLIEAMIDAVDEPDKIAATKDPARRYGTPSGGS